METMPGSSRRSTVAGGKVPWHPLPFKDKNTVLDLEMYVCADHPAEAPRNRSHSICNPIPFGNKPGRFL